MTSRVLVTGATGFIGHHLIPILLARGDHVTCLVRRTSDTSALEGTGVAFAYGDITQAESLVAPLSAVEAAIHLAGVTTARSPAEFLAINRDGTRNLAAACSKLASSPTLVLLSSLAAAGPSRADRPRAETDEPAPVSAYGRSKLAGERAARSFADRVPTTVVRAPWVYGERDRDTCKIFRMLRLGLLVVPVPASIRYSLVHATDLAAFLALAASRGERISNQAGDSGIGLYHVAGDEQPTYAELGLAISQAMGRGRPRIVHAPKPLILGVAALREMAARTMRRPPDIVNLDKAKEGFAGSWTCSAEKAKRHLSFAAARPLAERLRQTADWYRDQGWL